MLVNYIENVFLREDLAVIVTCITDKGWTVTRDYKRISKQEVELPKHQSGSC